MKDMSSEVKVLAGELRAKADTVSQHTSHPSNVSAIGISANHGGPVLWDQLRTTMLRNRQ